MVQAYLTPWYAYTTHPGTGLPHTLVRLYHTPWLAYTKHLGQTSHKGATAHEDVQE
ncbi:MAG: hypothetical protein JXR39_08445 [Marinilabiliaceae bacterium]|nr:hypothetical protein [Marinilabiliaceae bacterium]